MRLRFGLGAWSNAHFDHALYPLGTRHAEWLPRYATLFDCAEADILHHREADAGALEEWVRSTPDGFTFLPKMHKTATHGRRLLPGEAAEPPSVTAAEATLDSLEHLARAGRLGPVLLQFPPGTDRPAGWSHLTDLLTLRPPGTFAVEVRHPSWFVPAFEDLLEDFDAPLVWSTWPKAFAPPWRTGSTGYVRFTGRHVHTRGRHVTVEERLGDVLEIRKRLREASWKECFVIVTNPFEGNAVDSLPRVAAALAGPAAGRRFAREPAAVLFPDAQRGP